MDQLSPALINQLIDSPHQACVSIYMPTEKTSPQSHQNPIRFQNLAKQAKEIMDQSPLTTHQLKNQYQQAIQKIQDDEFWQHQSRGLAVFISEANHLFLRLPLKFKELVSVNHHCHFKPLLPLLTTNGKYHLLTLSQNDIKLYQATRTDIDKIFLGDIPRSLQDTIDSDDLQQHLQSHSPSSNRNRGKTATYHGQGGSGDKQLKKQIDEFIHLVADGIDQLLTGDKSPLILAGTEYLVAMFRKHSKHPHITDQHLPGNLEHLTQQKLHSKAWQTIRPLFKQAEKNALDAFHAKQGSNQTSTNLLKILPAAHGGRIHTLFVLRDHQTWGTFDPTKNKIQIDKTQTPHNEDLADLATIRTLQNSGQVFSLKQHEMPTGSEFIAALFRY